MRDYLTFDNFKKSVGLAGPVSLTAVIRYREAGVDPVFFMVAGFLLMTLAAGSVMAWGTSAGMTGAFPRSPRVWIGAGVAALLAVAVLAAHVFVLQPVLRPAIEATGDAMVVRLRYPETFLGRLGLMAWSAGLEALLLPATAMCFLARLTGRVPLAVCGTVALRVLLLSQQLAHAGVVSAVPVFLGSTALSCAIASVLFARAGLPAVMVFAAVVDVHVWL